jgi:hypothetical protein
MTAPSLLYVLGNLKKIIYRQIHEEFNARERRYSKTDGTFS